jgi:hypothetical protein
VSSLWIEAIKQANPSYILRKSHTVCSRHFTHHERLVRLCSGAVPAINLPQAPQALQVSQSQQATHAGQAPKTSNQINFMEWEERFSMDEGEGMKDIPHHRYNFDFNTYLLFNWLN